MMRRGKGECSEDEMGFKSGIGMKVGKGNA